MRELAVVLDVEQRVGVAADEEVDVGQHAGGGANHPAGVAERSAELRAEHGPGGDGAEQAVGQRVHARTGPSGSGTASYLRLQATGQTVLLPGGTMLPSSLTMAGRTLRRASGSLRTSDKSRKSRR